MKKLICIIILMFFFVSSVSAVSYEAPVAPESAEKYMPEETSSFAEGIWFVLKSAISAIMPSVRQAASSCFSILATILLLSIVQNFYDGAKKISILIAVIAIGTIVLQSTNSLIHLGAETVTQVSDYGMLLIPVMTAALSAQGGVTSSAALYAGTMFFNSLLTTLISGVVVPLIYIYFALCLAAAATGNDALKGLKDLVKWLSTWLIKIVLYVLTGYLSITGIISGSVDSSAIKATKLAISGAVPVVGGILSDASETILVSAGLVKNSIGIYGLIVILAITIGPFLQIGLQYLLLKLTAAVSSVFGEKKCCALVADLSGTMGFVLAITGTVCLLFLISTVCFMRGIA